MTTASIDSADVNWCNVLAHHAGRTPDRVLTLFEGEATTYGEMAGRVAALAGGLAGRGVGPGDVVAILSYNCPEFLETLFAANYLGAIAMPINWRLAAPEVRYILEHSGRGPWSATKPCSPWPKRQPTVSTTRSCGSAWRRSTRRDGRPSATFAAAPRGRSRLPRPATMSTG